MSPQDTGSLTSRWDSALMRNYGTPPLELVSGEGVVVTDASGKEYVDLLAGIAVIAAIHPPSAVAAFAVGKFLRYLLPDESYTKIT